MCGACGSPSDWPDFTAIESTGRGGKDPDTDVFSKRDPELSCLRVSRSAWLPPDRPVEEFRDGFGKTRHQICDGPQIPIFAPVHLKDHAAVERLDFRPVCRAHVTGARESHARPRKGDP